jgi:hypothetical protein
MRSGISCSLIARGGVPKALVIPAVGAIGGSLRSVLP